eukprot:6711369-Pyramimonas_sp.AAC.1
MLLGKYSGRCFVRVTPRFSEPGAPRGARHRLSRGCGASTALLVHLRFCAHFPWAPSLGLSAPAAGP